MAITLCHLWGWCKPQVQPQVPQEIQAFEQALVQQAMAPLNLDQPLNTLKKAFSERQVRLEHPRDIYPLYVAVMKITTVLAASNFETLKQSWKSVLDNLNQRKIYRIGLGEIAFDTSVALNALKSNTNSFPVTASMLDVTQHDNRQELLDYVLATDWEAFGTCFRRGFMEAIFKSEHVRCIVARDATGKIVGTLWGFLNRESDGKQFHFWELSRKAPMANMGIAKALIDCAKQQQRLYPNLQFVTLNVKKTNAHARELYQSEHFGQQDEELDRLFMARNAINGQQLQIPAEAKEAVKNFVVNTVPKFKLVYYELSRRCELAWRWAWYR